MPELPEVETTRCGIEPHIVDKTVTLVIVRQSALRWPVSPTLAEELTGSSIRSVDRRGKYLLLSAAQGTLLAHLGMSGSFRVLPANTPAGKHDHVDICFADQTLLRFNDPRRFGCLLWVADEVAQHALLSRLGPEPLGEHFNGRYLWQQGRGRRTPVKAFIMDSHVVVGVGNIYANEALYMAGIHPRRAAGRIALARFEKLSTAIRRVLQKAIEAGGTTLRDFTNSNGDPGYFKQSLNVYGRSGEPCRQCGSLLREIRLCGRSTVYCSRCQN